MTTHILDRSPTGTGKSFAIAQFTKPFGVDKVILVSSTYRNPSIANIQQRYKALPARHNGLHQTGDPLPGGGYKTFRASKERPANTRGNCHWADKFQRLAEKGYSSRGLCQQCPLKTECRNEVGVGYGYHYEKAAAFAADYLRCAPQSLPKEPAFYQNSLLFLDEVGTLLEPEARSMSTHEIERVLELFRQSPQFTPYCKPLEDLLYHCARADKWGTRVQLELPTVDDPEAYQIPVFDFDEVTENSPPSPVKWLHDAKVIRCHRNRVVLYSPPERLLLAVKHASVVIAQDATTRPEDYSLAVGVPLHEIHVVSQETPSTENLKVYRLPHEARPGRRDDDLINDVVTGMRDRFGGQLAVFDKKIGKSDKDAYFFSSDTRGGNSFQDRTVFLQIGVPRSNLGAVQDRYLTLGGHRSGLRLYYEACVEAEQVQVFGRARANRRPDTEIVWVIVSNMAIPGCKSTAINSIDEI